MEEPEEESCCMCNQVVDFFIRVEDDGIEYSYCPDCYDIHEMEE